MIDGHGILAKEFIPANYLIGISHVEEADPKYFHNGLYRTPLGGFLNHSPNPNCVLIQGILYWHLWTTEDIPIDDELCVDYNFYRCGFKENE